MGNHTGQQYHKGIQKTMILNQVSLEAKHLLPSAGGFVLTFANCFNEIKGPNKLTMPSFEQVPERARLWYIRSGKQKQHWDAEYNLLHVP